MIRFLSFITALFLATPAVADATMVSSEIAWLEVGVICAPDTVFTNPAPDTIAGVTHVIDEIPVFISDSQRIPAALGVAFGVKSQARTTDGLSNVTITVSHPPIGASGITQQSFGTFIRGEGISISFYQFDTIDELQIGTWAITATRAGKPLYVVNFEVVPPEQLPELADACDYTDLFS